MAEFGKRQGGGRRQASREALPLIAVFTTRTRSHDAVLVDLSTTGARLRGANLPGPDEDLMLNMEGISAFGIVRWSQLGFCGIEFETPLPPQEVKRLERQARAGRGISPDVRAARDDWTIGVAR